MLKRESSPNIAIYAVGGQRSLVRLTLVRGCGKGPGLPGSLSLMARVGSFHGHLEGAVRVGIRQIPIDPSAEFSILYAPKHEAKILNSLSDHALGLIHRIVKGHAYPELCLTEGEIVFCIEGAATPMMGILWPDETVRVLAFTSPDNQLPIVAIGNLRHVAIRPVDEGTYQLPAGTFDLAYAGIHAAEHYEAEPSDWEQELLARLWNACADVDPLVRKPDFDHQMNASMTFAHGDEGEMAKLITWALTLNDSHPERQAVLQHTHMMRAQATVVSATPGKTFQASCRFSSVATSRIVQEIVAAFWPRGATAGAFKTNRRSSAGLVGAERIFKSPGADISSHELLEARAGLEDFLLSRKIGEPEIAALLDAYEGH